MAAVVLVAALLATACGSTAPLPSQAQNSALPASAAPSAIATLLVATAAPTLGSPPPVSWSDCGGGFECGSVDVPRDYADPLGPVVRLALIRLAAGDPAHRIGSLVVNPGGPGESGIDFVRQDATVLFPPEILARFDIVGFDPRGVGSSTPVHCLDTLDPSSRRT